MKVLRFLIIGEKYLGCHLPLGLFSCGQFSQDCPKDNYQGNKSSKRKFYLGAIFRGILLGENYLWSNFLGAIIRGQSFRGKLPGGILFRSSYPWGQLSERGTMICQIITDKRRTLFKAFVVCQFIYCPLE